MEFGVRGAGGQSPRGKPHKHEDEKEKANQIPTFMLEDKDTAIDGDAKVSAGNDGIQPTLDLRFENTFLHYKHP